MPAPEKLSALAAVNLAVRFLLELCALAALGYWGFHAGRGLGGKLALGIGAPLLAALVWGTFVAPRAPVRLPLRRRLIPELVVFGAATAALVAAGHPLLALAFAVVVAASSGYLYVTGQGVEPR